MPFKQSKINIQRIESESVLLSHAKWDTFISSKVFISFVELSVLYTDPTRKLYIVFESIYFDDKLSFRVNFFDLRIFNALSMSLKI